MKWRYIVGLSILFITAVRFAYEKPKLSVDRCSAKLMLLRGDYRSWGVDYCYGFQTRKDGSEKHFYHWPIFIHADAHGIVYMSQGWTNAQGFDISTMLASPASDTNRIAEAPYRFDATAKKE